MYNPQQKKKYLESLSGNSKIAKATQIFLLFAEYECEWGMDLSLQTADILQPVFNKITGVKSKGVEVVLSSLRSYVRWCAHNGYKVSRGVFELKVETIEKIKQQMVASPKDLQNRLKKHFDLPEKETIDVVYRTFFWLAFIGLKDSEAILITADMVNLSELYVECNGRRYEFGREAKEDFDKACKLMSFNYEHTSPHYFVRRDRVAGDFILRGFRAANINLTTFRPMINKRITCRLGDKYSSNDKQNKTPISYRKIYFSGLFYRMYEFERAGDIESFTAEINKEAVSDTIRKQYLNDYEKWKMAFEV